jgi:DMSO/TMAO reductase YedYZ heme-binding membrane subunit
MNSPGRRPPVNLLLLAVGTVLAVWLVISYRAGGYYLDRDVFACQLSGYAAIGYLALSLITGPIIRLLGFTGVAIEKELSAQLSRNAGIASALAAGLHTIIALTTYLKADWLVVFQIHYLQSGAAALFVLLVLLLGSYKPLMGFARWKLWKPLFRLSFLAAILTLLHVLYAPFAPRPLTIGLAVATIVVCLSRWFPERNPVR